MMFLFIYLLFIPPIITMVEFLVFLASGKKPMNGVLGFLLDVIQIVWYPLMYIQIFNSGSGLQLISQEPNSYFFFGIFSAIVIGYFLVTYFNYALRPPLIIFILGLLGLGLFINLYIMFNQETFLSFFNIPILLLFIMQIASNTIQLTTEKNNL